MSKQYRVAICSYTKKEIVQVKHDNKWLCLHNDDELLDKIRVDAFKTGRRLGKRDFNIKQ